jgi:CTP:phosphocholine cytidylyltransferase-like protein
MKYLVIVLTIFVLSSCNLSSVSTKTQVPNRAYVYVVGDKTKYSTNDIYMQYDDKEKFSVVIQKEQTSKQKLILYEIVPGTHNIKIYSGNTLIINTKAFISNQETKKIILP